MRRVLGWVSIIVGFTLIFLAIFFRVYVKPRVEKAPYDVDERKISFGTGKYFSAPRLALVGPTRLAAIQIYKGIPEQSTDDVAAISLFARIVDLTGGAKADVLYDRQIYAMDRRTGMAVHCCGEEPRHEGVTLKFPFGTQKDQTYQFWDGTAKQAFPARYTRDETVEGLKTFVFVSHVPPTDIGELDLPGSLVGRSNTPTVTTRRMYDSTTTIWVEPTTGAILRAARHSRQWAGDTDGTRLLVLADLDLVYSGETVLAAAEDVKSSIGRLKIVTTWVPIFGPIAGVILIALGLILTRPSRRPTARPTGTSAAPARSAQPRGAGT